MFPFSNIARCRMASYWAHCALFWLKATCNLGFEVRGRENIPNHPSIILCKHQSAWETIALQVIFPPQIWVMKRELLYIPFLGWAWIALSAIPIDRSAGREALKKLVAHGKDRLAKGLWVVIFPEGTRIAPRATCQISHWRCLASHTYANYCCACCAQCRLVLA